MGFLSKTLLLLTVVLKIFAKYFSDKIFFIRVLVMLGIVQCGAVRCTAQPVNF